MTTVLGLHWPGSSWLHRLPPGAKLLGLMVIGTVVVVVRGPVPALVGLVVALGVLVSTGVPLRPTLRGLRGLVVVVLLLGAWNAWQNGWPRAVESVADLVALIVLATAVTVTTPVDETMDGITWALGPLRPVA